MQEGYGKLILYTSLSHWYLERIQTKLTIFADYCSCCIIEGSKQNITIIQFDVAAYAALCILLTRFTSLSSTCSTNLIGSSMKPISKPIVNFGTFYLRFFYFRSLATSYNLSTFKRVKASHRSMMLICISTRQNCHGRRRENSNIFSKYAGNGAS